MASLGKLRFAPANLRSVIYFKNAGLHRVTNSDRVGDMEPEYVAKVFTKIQYWAY